MQMVVAKGIRDDGEAGTMVGSGPALGTFSSFIGYEGISITFGGKDAVSG